MSLQHFAPLCVLTPSGFYVKNSLNREERKEGTRKEAQRKAHLPCRLSAACYTPRALSSTRKAGAIAQMDSDLLDPYEKLIGIEILGQRVFVPENNRLLRCFQYLSMETISYGDFCWNGDCTNCQIWYHTEGQTEADDRAALSCRTEVREGMVITRMNSCIEMYGINKKSPEPETRRSRTASANELQTHDLLNVTGDNQS
jgi:hypothetical protein